METGCTYLKETQYAAVQYYILLVFSNSCVQYCFLYSCVSTQADIIYTPDTQVYLPLTRQYSEFERTVAESQ